MKKGIFLLSIITLTFATSCTDQGNLNSEINPAKNAIVINDNQNLLNQRLDLTNSGVVSIINPSTRKNLVTESEQFPLTQIAEFNAPKDSQGRSLQANHVAVNGNYAYVAYTLQGNEYSGAIDMIDVSDPYLPKLVMSALIADTDITSLVYTNGKLIIGGATNSDKNTAIQSPAIVMYMELTSSGALTNNYSTNDISSFAATDVTANSSNYFAVSGDTGSLYKFDNTTKQILGSKSIEDLRSVAVINDKIVTLSGTKGINIYNTLNLELIKSFSTWKDEVQGAKRTIDFIGDKLFVSEGYQGLGVYNMTSGTKIQTIALIPTATTEPDDVVTNAVSVNGEYVFVANGGNGLNVYKSSDQLALIGTVGINGSANYVKTSGNYIYVASGKGGLKIIKMEKRITTPSINCSGLPVYNGGQELNINSGQTVGYSGSTAINKANINATFTHCGAISIQNDVNINSGGIFKMYGTLSQGKYQQANPTRFIVNGELQIEGSVVIWGDFVMNSGAKISFLGNDSSITVFGKVTKNSGVTITGKYTGTNL